MAKINTKVNQRQQQSGNTKCWRGCRTVGTLTTAAGNVKRSGHGESSWQLLKEFNTESPCDPAISLLGIYPREIKTYVHSKTYTGMFIAALFTVAPNWKGLEYPPAGEQRNKL